MGYRAVGLIVGFKVSSAINILRMECKGMDSEIDGEDLEMWGLLWWK